MDQTVEIEQSELELVAEELDVKTEMKDIKSEVDADGKIERLNHEQAIDEKQDGNNFPIIPNNLIKTEKVKDEPEIYVKDTDTLPLNKELKIKNDVCADLESSYPDFKRRKTEDNTEKWNDSVLSMTNMVFKADPDASSLHTEFDIKNESNPSTSAVPTTREEGFKKSVTTTMDQTVKIEESELELVAEELDVKTEMKDIKSEVDADGKIERLNHEQTIDEKQDGNNFPIIPNNLIKIEKVKDEPEIYVKDTDTLPLNKELKIKNEVCADLESSYPDFKRRKTEDNTGKWNDSVLSMTNMVFKADPDVSSLHTEFDIKNESNPSTSAVPTTRCPPMPYTNSDDDFQPSPAKRSAPQPSASMAGPSQTTRKRTAPVKVMTGTKRQKKDGSASENKLGAKQSKPSRKMKESLPSTSMPQKKRKEGVTMKSCKSAYKTYAAQYQQSEPFFFTSVAAPESTGDISILNETPIVTDPTSFRKSPIRVLTGLEEPGVVSSSITPPDRCQAKIVVHENLLVIAPVELSTKAPSEPDEGMSTPERYRTLSPTPSRKLPATPRTPKILATEPSQESLASSASKASGSSSSSGSSGSSSSSSSSSEEVATTTNETTMLDALESFYAGQLQKVERDLQKAVADKIKLSAEVQSLQTLVEEKRSVDEERQRSCSWISGQQSSMVRCKLVNVGGTAADRWERVAQLLEKKEKLVGRIATVKSYKYDPICLPQSQ